MAAILSRPQYVLKQRQRNCQRSAVLAICAGNHLRVLMTSWHGWIPLHTILCVESDGFTLQRSDNTKFLRFLYYNIISTEIRYVNPHMTSAWCIASVAVGFRRHSVHYVVFPTLLSLSVFKAKDIGVDHRLPLDATHMDGNRKERFPLLYIFSVNLTSHLRTEVAFWSLLLQ